MRPKLLCVGWGVSCGLAIALSGCAQDLDAMHAAGLSPDMEVATGSTGTTERKWKTEVHAANKKTETSAGVSARKSKAGRAHIGHSVRLALARHPDIGRSMADVARSGGELEVAEAEWYPKLAYKSDLGSSNGSTSGSGTAGLELNQLVYDFGRADNQILAARAVKDQRNAEVMDAQERVALTATEAFLEIARSQALVQANDRYLTALVNLRTQIELRADSGAANKADVYLAETRVQSAKGDRIKSQTRLFASQAKLFRITGEKIDKVTDPAPVMQRLARSVTSAPEDSGTGVIAATMATDAARARLKVAEAALYPSFGVKAGYNYPFGDTGSTNNFQADQSDYFINLSVKGDLLSGGANQGRINAAASEAASAEQQTALVRLNNATEVAVAQAEVDGAKQRTSAYAKQLESARKARETSLSEYQIGRKTLVEVLTTEQEIFRAETDQVNATSDAGIAIARAAAARQLLVRDLAPDSVVN